VPRDAAATRARILDAAVEEFSAHGLAGARIDRIAEAAQANKRLIYVHFGDKDGLFDAALHAVIDALVTTVPLTEDDLPGYAGRTFDYLQDHPEAVRLSTWRKLERPGDPRDDAGFFAGKVAAMERRGDDAIAPLDLIVLVTTLAAAWFNAPDGLLAAEGGDPMAPERLARHRAAVVEAARRLVAD
jgi:AcrR family transcriptional regulator